MASNTFSVGRDCQLVVMGPFGRVDLTHVTGFESRQVTAAVRVDRIDGVQLAAELPKGWDGAFELEGGAEGGPDGDGEADQEGQGDGPGGGADAGGVLLAAGAAGP